MLIGSGCSREAEASEEAPAVVEQAAATIEVPATESAPAVSYDPRKSLAPMIKRVGPAVVSIRAFGRKGPARAGFFGRRGEVSASGSGFVLSADGIVVTNHHVVDGSKRLEVHLPDGRKFEADLLGSDRATDLAVLQVIDGSELPTAELGNSKDLEVGDWVVAIGSPMGLEHSASVGILSGRGRGSLGLYEDSYLDFLQTDADIAPGSSGGPLFDLQGRVVGITTAVGAGSRPGFAIPIDQAKEIVPQIRKEGKVVRGWLGASSDPQAAKADGAVIGQVYRDTPAAEAGLVAGDIVKKVDGNAIEDFDALRHAIAGLQPGHTVLLEVERDGKTVELTTVLEERPAKADLDLRPARRSHTTPTPPESPPSSGARLGVQAREVDNGLEVVRIQPDSLADDLDLQPGDVIVNLNGEAIKTRKDVADALARSRDSITVELQRDGVTHNVTLEKS